MIPTMSGPDVPRTHAPSGAPPPAEPPAAETCDHCGSTDLAWVKCKLICGNCRQINKSCADL
ncbi:MAG TPA: hypothetical protein VNE60_13270 [Gemmatimonadaceae bacterium]|nr:hypothetical protein [Gemmatimonadaceae bacterium]